MIGEALQRTCIKSYWFDLGSPAFAFINIKCCFYREKYQNLFKQVTKCLTASWLTIVWVFCLSCDKYPLVFGCCGRRVERLQNSWCSSMSYFQALRWFSFLKGFLFIFFKGKKKILLQKHSVSLGLTFPWANRGESCMISKSIFQACLSSSKKNRIPEVQLSSLCLFSCNANYTELCVAVNVNIAKDSVAICRA